jgi:signal transduction histidine kinase
MVTIESSGDAPTRSAPGRVRRWSLLAAMIVSVATVAALAYYDAQREAAVALSDFGDAQATLAQAVASSLAGRLASEPTSPPARIVGTLRHLEQPGLVELLFAPPGSKFIDTDGRLMKAPAIERAVAEGEPWVRLSRPEAAALGLPERTAFAGIATLGSDPASRWSVVVVATAQAERDRELRAQWRLVLGVAVAAGLVLAFGGFALRMQRKELELARELEIAEMTRERDERLGRADKLATLGALATGIAHEVSTPLGVILGRADQLRSKVNGDERADRALNAIVEQGERIERVVRGFLSLARGEVPAFDYVSPWAIVRSSVDLVEHRFAKAGVELRAKFVGSLPKIACEPRLLEQALINLLLNACDACEPGGHVSVTVSGAERVVFDVTDDGQGIPRESAARTLEPFFTTKPAEKGTGLGLAIATEIVKHHRGSLSIEPRESVRGTRACIEVPAASKGEDHEPAIIH